MAGNWHRIGDIKGRDGVGVPTGGARGDVLKKEGGTDFATSWGAVNYADIEGKVPASALPEIGTAPYVVDSQAAMLNLPAVPGRQAIRTDIGATFVLAEEPASELGNWVEMVSRSDVTSVNGKTGAVELTKADVGLSEVNNTADSDKPEATQSVRGLMSPEDKTKLDKATYVATNGTLVERSSSGYVNIRQVVLSDQPSNSAHSVPLGFLQTALESKYGTGNQLSSTEDLNDLKSDEVHIQSMNANASLDRNYPIEHAGTLWVKSNSSEGMVYQTYMTYHTRTTAIYWRTHYSGTWGDWKQVAEHELATPSSDGLMPRADKSLLDGASNGATANSLVIRNSAGRFNAADPTSDGQVANKGYVDREVSAVGGRVDDTNSRLDNSLFGRGRVDGESWNNIRRTVSAVIDEDSPTGSPTYTGKYDSGTEIPFGFNKVWLLDVTDLGLNYIKQRAQILRASPTYLVGFAWERIWDPSASHWTDWTTVSGTTGPLPTTHPTTQGGIENIEVSPLSLSTNMIPFTSGVPLMMTRTLDTVHIRGQITTRLDSFGDGLRSTDGILALYMAGRLGTAPVGFFSAASPRAASGVMQGSYRYRWYLNGATGSDQPLITRWRAARHDALAENLNSGTWLPITLSYSVRTPGVVGTADPGDGEGDEGSTGGTEG